MKAWELLAEGPHRWTQGAYARDSKGSSVFPGHLAAQCWCMSGAIYKAYLILDVGYLALRFSRYEELCEKIESLPVRYNDTHTYEEVLAVLKELDI